MTVTSYYVFQPTLELKSDLAAAHPLYIYLSEKCNKIIYSINLPFLLKEITKHEDLRISEQGLSFLLMSGVIPPPRTIYKNLYILGVGDKAYCVTNKYRVSIEFDYKFPFSNSKRLIGSSNESDDLTFLESMANNVIENIVDGRPSFLFHSAGKDSNTIALALAEGGLQDRVSFVTHKSHGMRDESEISKDIARKLGFRHRILHEYNSLNESLHLEVNEYFSKAPFPCVDGVSLAYPIYAWQMPELKGSNIIDGMGNDVFMGHIPSIGEFKKQKWSGILQYLRFAAKRVNSESLLYALGKYRSEHTGLSGFSFRDAQKIFRDTQDPTDIWKEFDHSQDYLDLRAEVRGKVIDQEIFIRKVRNFTDAYQSRLILPWAAENMASWFCELPEEKMFSRRHLKNKLYLRRLLNRRLDLDSDKLGKMGFSYNKKSIVRENRSWVESEIQRCDLWDSSETSHIVRRLYSQGTNKGRVGVVALSLIYRLLLISLWFNNSVYINRSGK